MGFPASITNGLPGNRVEPYLAGMTTTTLANFGSLILPCPGIIAAPTQSTLGREFRAGMLSHAMQSSRPIELSNIEHQSIALVFENQSGRIRVLSFSVHLLLIVCLLLLLAVLPAAGQSGPDENKPKDEAKREEVKEVKKDDVRKDSPGTAFKPGGTIHFDVDLALVNVTVTDPYNRLVTGLETDNFRVFEDNIEQEVVTFSAEDVPISIGVIFDFSGSMSNKVGKAREAALQFFKTANPQDEFFLVSFNERAELTS